MRGLIDTYLTRLTLSGMRPKTIRAKRFCLNAFAGTVPDLRTATREDIEAFLGRPLAPASRRSYADHIKGFYRYLKDEGLRLDDPTEKLPRFREPRGLPRPIPSEQLALALTLAPRRMRAWLLLMSLGGLRCMEVAGLLPQDLLETHTGPILYLREVKGGGTATVPAHEAIVAALRDLPVRNGEWWSVTANTVSTEVSAYLHTIGISATAHQLRHYAGTSWYEASGNDLLTTAALLRHVNVNTSQVYAKVNPRRPAEVVNLVPLPSAS